MIRKSIVAALACFSLAFAALADEISTPRLGNTHLSLGGGQALLDLSNPNAVSINGLRSSTFLANINTNAITNVFTRFVEGQRAFITLANPGTNQNAQVTFSDTGAIYYVPTNNPLPVIVEASYIDGTYRTRSISEPTFRQLFLGTNQVANWPTNSPAINQPLLVTSNNVVFILTTTLSSRAWAATNKLAP